MNIIGPDTLVFGVDDVAACVRYLTAYGLDPVAVDANGGRFEALDGTAIVVRRRDDPSLPASSSAANTLRQTVYGVADQATVEAIGNELARDRQIKRLPDGAVEAADDDGFGLRFQVTVRRKLEMPGERINAPGSQPQRGVNQIGVWQEMAAKPRTLSHVVFFVPDWAASEAFYTQRLGFRVSDRFVNAGPFLRPAGTNEHHTLFFIQTPPYMKGCEHFAFHLGGPTEMMLAGSRFVRAGYKSFWGPGRHKFGSNWFWYFDSPLGCHVEYDADMDLHDDEWVARQLKISAEETQAFLFEYREPWMPGGPPPGGKPENH